TVMRKTASFDTIFSDYDQVCDDRCFECAQCLGRLSRVAQVLTDPDSRVWEVWRFNDSGWEIVGILYLTDIKPGQDATAHYVFFDGRLADKTELLEGMIQWAFEDHPDVGWHGLTRLTVEVPDFASALAKHAYRRLGFSGDFRYVSGTLEIFVEG